MDAEKPVSVATPETHVKVFSGEIVAENVPYEDYLKGLSGEHAEWLYGVVIKMSPVSVRHGRISNFLSVIFRGYLELTTGGEVFHDPVVMRPSDDLPARQPDVQVLLPDRLDYVKDNQVAGPANLVVEIISPESVQRDRGEKFQEYERGGVDEYWIIDPQRKEALFYVRGEDELYHSRPPVGGVYTSRVLDKLALPVDLFWQEKLPSMREAAQMVEAMLENA